MFNNFPWPLTYSFPSHQSLKRALLFSRTVTLSRRLLMWKTKKEDRVLWKMCTNFFTKQIRSKGFLAFFIKSLCFIRLMLKSLVLSFPCLWDLRSVTEDLLCFYVSSFLSFSLSKSLFLDIISSIQLFCLFICLLFFFTFFLLSFR